MGTLKIRALTIIYLNFKLTDMNDDITRRYWQIDMIAIRYILSEKDYRVTIERGISDLKSNRSIPGNSVGVCSVFIFLEIFYIKPVY